VPQAHADYASMDPERLLGIIGGLHPASLRSGRALADRYDFGAYAHVLDVGGGSAGMSIGLAEACPELRVTVADLPYVLPITQRYISDAGLASRIRTVGIDVLKTVLEGPFDAVVMRFFLQILSADEIPVALSNIAAALRPGGMLYTINFMLDDNRITPLASNLINVQFLSHYDRGQAYTDGEYRRWLTDAGFIDISRSEDVVGIPLLVARKAG
jgi:ubiquinone/menaquinone biosynthesis C-methylase UbiE